MVLSDLEPINNTPIFPEKQALPNPWIQVCAVAECRYIGFYIRYDMKARFTEVFLNEYAPRELIQVVMISGPIPLFSSMLTTVQHFHLVIRVRHR